MMQKFFVTKADGKSEPYARNRLLDSLLRAGASQNAAEKVIEAVERKLKPGISTQKLWHLARRILHRLEKQSGVRYGLKQAIMELGPTGFPFEKYVAAILAAYGYEVKIGQIVKGFCVNHEVDVIAKQGEKHFLIETKYHNQPGIRSDVKVALYILARFQDIRRAWESDPEHSKDFHGAWLITNTKCTSDAIEFSQCAGLKIISWRYPEEGSLEKLIEAKKLYPITILPSLRGEAKHKLVEANVMLAKDFLEIELHSLAKEYRMNLHHLLKLKEEATLICR